MGGEGKKIYKIALKVKQKARIRAIRRARQQPIAFPAAELAPEDGNYLC
jgi:hypothetical protein